MSLFYAVYGYLKEHPRTQTREMLSLGEKKDINALLYANSDLFKCVQTEKAPLWLISDKLPDDDERLVTYIKNNPRVTAKDLVSYMGVESTKQVNPTLYRLLGKKIISCDKTSIPPTWS